MRAPSPRRWRPRAKAVRTISSGSKASDQSSKSSATPWASSTSIRSLLGQPDETGVGELRTLKGSKAARRATNGLHQAKLLAAGRGDRVLQARRQRLGLLRKHSNGPRHIRGRAGEKRAHGRACYRGINASLDLGPMDRTNARSAGQVRISLRLCRPCGAYLVDGCDVSNLACASGHERMTLRC